MLSVRVVCLVVLVGVLLHALSKIASNTRLSRRLRRSKAGTSSPASARVMVAGCCVMLSAMSYVMNKVMVSPLFNSSGVLNSRVRLAGRVPGLVVWLMGWSLLSSCPLLLVSAMRVMVVMLAGRVSPCAFSWMVRVLRVVGPELLGLVRLNCKARMLVSPGWASGMAGRVMGWALMVLSSSLMVMVGVWVRLL